MANPASMVDSGDRYAAAAPLDIPTGWPNRAASRRYTLPEVSLHVQRLGQGRPILLLHGTGSATHTWRDLLPRLAHRFDVIAPDLPGHGGSSMPPARCMSVAGMAATLCTLLRMLGVHPTAIVGHSAGAAIALKMAGLLGEPVPQLLAINGAFEPFGGRHAMVFAPLARAIAALPHLAGFASRRARDRDAVQRLLAGTGSRPDPQTVADYQRVLTNERHVRATLRMMAQWDLRSLPQDLAMHAGRCHLLVGDRDRAVPPEQGRRLQRRYPALRLTVLPGVGHLAHEEDAARVDEWIRGVLDEDAHAV